MDNKSPPEILFTTLGAPRPTRPTGPPWHTSTDLIAREAGTVTLRGRFAAYFTAIEADFKRFGASLQAEEVIVPGSLSVHDLRRGGTLVYFPHLLHFLSPLALEQKPLAPHAPLRPLLKEPLRACCSAVCLPVYSCFEGRLFQAGQSEVLTLSGRCYRTEDLKTPALERLTEFHMREVVFLGDAEFVERSVARSEEWMRELLMESGLRGAIRVAEDPFFSTAAPALHFYQRTARTKIELCLEKPETGELVAICSLNRHETHFAKAYDIRLTNGDFVQTACFGLGLERMLFMILAQFGADDTQWPARLRRRLLSQVSELSP